MAGGGTPKIVLAPGTTLPAGVRILQAGTGTPTTMAGGQRVVFLSSALTGTTPTATIITRSVTQPTTSVIDTKAEPVTPKKIPQVDGADDEPEPDPKPKAVQEKKPTVSKSPKSTLETALLGQGTATQSATSGMSFNRMKQSINFDFEGLKVEMPGAAPPLQMLSDDPDPPSAVKTESNADTDPLATLASAAISSAVSNGSSQLSASPQTKPLAVKQPLKNKNQWYDVGILKSNQYTVQHFLITPEGVEKRDPESDFDSNSVPNLNSYIKAELEPGTAYKLRVAAINACGRGPWSEISAFKTCLPGYPGAPSAIKITKVCNN